MIGAPDREQNDSHAAWKQQGCAIIVRHVREKIHKADEEENKEHIRYFPYRGEVTLDDVVDDVAFAGNGAVIAEEACAKINGRYNQVAV